MRVRSKLKPGQPGTRRLVEQYGDRLVCVRYRYDALKRRRYTTAEIIVDESDWDPMPSATARRERVPVRIAVHEVKLREKVKAIVGLSVLMGTILAGCVTAPSRLVIAQVQGPFTAKGPTGDVVWTNEAGFLIKWAPEVQSEFFVCTQSPPRIRHATSFEDFLKMFGEFPSGTRLDWVNTCCAPVSWGMPEENKKRLMAFLSEHHLMLLKSDEGHTIICRCESTNTIWFMELKTGDANEVPEDTARKRADPQH